MTYVELADLLAAAGLSVVVPGHQMVALPAITLEPTGLSVIDGYRVVYRECNIVVRYPLGEGNTAQFDLLEQSVHAVLSTIAGSPVQFDADIDIFADADSTPVAIKATIGARFPGDDICVTPAAVPVALVLDPDPDPDPEETEE